MTPNRPPLSRHELFRIRHAMSVRQLVAYERGYGVAHDGDETVDVPVERSAGGAKSVTWLTTPLPPRELQFIEAYARAEGVSRAVVVRHAIRVLRQARRAAHRALQPDDERVRHGPPGGW